MVREKKAPIHHCVDCGKEISSTATRCKSCVAKKRWEPGGALRRKHDSPEYQREQSKRLSKKASEQWESEEFRRKRSEDVKRQWESEEYRRRQSEEAKKKWKPGGVFRRKQESPEYQREKSEKAEKQWEPGGSLRERMQGSNNPSWRGGSSFEPYGPEFTDELKKSIRKRDGNTCALCGEPGDNVHHIDYDKKNSSPDNLITLCVSCHMKTNHKRKYWERKFKRRKK